MCEPASLSGAVLQNPTLFLSRFFWHCSSDCTHTDWQPARPTAGQYHCRRRVQDGQQRFDWLNISFAKTIKRLLVEGQWEKKEKKNDQTKQIHHANMSKLTKQRYVERHFPALLLLPYKMRSGVVCVSYTYLLFRY